ncbi:hypothetical protein LCGC14_1909670, partial [marine sediment metagenome]
MLDVLSDTGKRAMFQAALSAKYGLAGESPIPKKLAIEEVFDGEIIYNVDGQLYQMTYEMGESDGPTFGEPKKVLSTRIYRTMEALSFENRRSILDAALGTALNLGPDEWVFIEDMTETDIVYNRGRQAFRAPYVIAEDGSVTIGEPVKVTRQVIFTPMEALQTAYSELIQEAGKRNASMDVARVKKIMEMCQEILSSEAEPDEAKTQEAIKEAATVLVWLREQAATKTEDGVEFPAAAFAYVPDAEEPEGWRLRLWENLEKKVTKAQLGHAAAYLSPGGLRGQKVAIVAESLPAVKRLIRAEFRNLGVEEEDTPRWVKEAMTRETVTSFVPLTEATFDKGRATVIVIKPGFNADQSRYYPADMLKRDFKVFEGQKMYADHPTESEDKERPERSIRDWVATLSNVAVDEAGVVTGIAEIVEPWLMQKLASLREKKMLSEMGISINAIGKATKSTIENKETLVIEELTGARSVDFVTEPGAGGAVTFYESDRKRDIDLVELATLKERRPDLIKAVEANIREAVSKEVKKAMESEARITELEGQITTLTSERDELKEAKEQALKEKAKAEAQATIKEAVDKAELPDKAKARLVEQFKDSDNAEGITEAIDSMKSFIADLSETSKVKGLGQTNEDSDKDTKAFRESLKRSNPDWSDEQLEA